MQKAQETEEVVIDLSRSYSRAEGRHDLGLLARGHLRPAGRVGFGHHGDPELAGGDQLLDARAGVLRLNGQLAENDEEGNPGEHRSVAPNRVAQAVAPV